MRIAYTTSIWLALTVSIERYLAICRPLRHSQVFRRARVALIITTCIAAVAVLVNVAAFFEFTIARDNNGSSQAIQHTDEQPAVRMYYLILRMSTHYIIPLAFVIWLNTSVMRVIIKTKQFHLQLSIRQQRQLNCGSMFVVCIWLFIVCHAVPIVHYLLENFTPNWYIYENQRQYLILKVIDKRSGSTLVLWGGRVSLMR